MTERTALSDEQLIAILEAEETDAVGYFRSEIAADQEEALKAYYGEPFGDEVEGRSQVISLDVRETVEWMVPDLARIFMSGGQVAEAVAVGPDDDEAAEQATDYCNFVFLQDNPGFMLWQDWAKDGLIQKIGVMRVDWEEPDWQRPEHHRSLNTAQLQGFQKLEEAEQLEILDHAERQVKQDTFYFDGYAHDVRVRRMAEHGRVVISPVAPEEFLIRRASRSLEDAGYRAHRTYKTLSELIRMFPERQEELESRLPGDDDEDLDTRRQTRFADEDYYPADMPGAIDRASAEVKFLDEYIEVDYDGDGITELRNIKRAGNIILYNEEVDEDPFVDWCPLRVPHKFYGLSLADDTQDIQRIKSVLWRAALDSTYQQVAPRMLVNDGKVNMDDLLTVRPGQNIRVDSSVADVRSVVMPLMAPDVSGSAYKMLEYVDQEAEGRTGVTRHSQGLNPEALNKTATGIQLLQNAGSGRKEMIARNMAFGLEKLFRKILRHLVRSESAKRILRLRGGQYVPVDPSRWNPEMDMRVHVGLGTGSREQQMAHLAAITAKQEQVMLNAGPENPLVGWDNLYSAYTEFAEVAGFKGPERFFRNPKDWKPPAPAPQQPEGPDPQSVLVMSQLEALKADSARRDAESRARLMKMQADAELERQKLAAEQQERLARLQAEAAEREAELEKFRARYGLDEVRTAADVANRAADTELKRARARQAAADARKTNVEASDEHRQALEILEEDDGAIDR